jgi:hypothetical protein
MFAPFITHELLFPRADAPSNTSTPSPTAVPQQDDHHSSGLSGWAIFLIIIVVFGALSAVAFVLFRRSRRTRGTSSFGGASGSGPLDLAKGWFERATYKMRNPRARSTSAGFEGISAGRAADAAARTNRSALDPDEAWDSRVGNEAEYGGYYEETELQSHHLDDGRYEQLQHGTEYQGPGGRGRMPAENPFSDEHVATSLRSVSPRPVEDGEQHTGQHSPTRRSLFKEQV